jgi:hypothetical protein
MDYSPPPSPSELLATYISPCNTPPPNSEPSTTLTYTQVQQWREEARELMDITLDKWTYPTIPLTHIEDMRDSARMAARLAKIWALAQSDLTRTDSDCLTYHMERLWHFFDQANKVAAV